MLPARENLHLYLVAMPFNSLGPLQLMAIPAHRFQVLHPMGTAMGAISGDVAATAASIGNVHSATPIAPLPAVQ